MVVEVHDSAGELVGSLAKLPYASYGTVKESPPNFILRPLFESMAEVDARGSTITLAHGSKAEIRVLDDEFNLQTIIRWSDPARKVTGAHIRTWREGYLEDSSGGPYDDATLSSERPVADFFPIMTSVTIGRGGRIWVNLYDRPRPEEEQGWLVFESDGELSCRIDELPGDPWEFGADYVLVLHESEDEDETIRMYRVTSPS